MKHLLLFLTLFFLTHSSFAQEAFNAKGNNALQINIPNSDLAVQQTKTKVITLDIEISVNYPKAVIEQLQKVNRYQVSSKSKDGTLVFSMPNLEKGVTIGEKTLTEKIKITVKTPNGFTSKGNTIFNDKNLKTIEQSVQVNTHFVYPKERTAAKQSKESQASSAAKKSAKTKVPTATKEVQALYGDIIIGNMPIDDFYD
jgi:hypothetical protein